MIHKMCNSNHRNLWILLILDFFTKYWAVATLTHSVSLTSFLSFELVYNRGISWSLFAYQDQYFFNGLTIFIGCFLYGFSWYAHKRKQEGFCTLGEKLAIVGGTGNFIDRLYYGGVVDFIHLSYGGWSFPIFNIADVCIIVGVLIMVWQTYFAK